MLEGLKRFAEEGPPSEVELQVWLERLQRDLEIEMPTDDENRKALRDILEGIYARDVDRGGISKRIPGVDRYTIQQVLPRLRAELDRRIFAAADLIRINKAQRKAQTLQRFAGWITSIPVGGSNETDLRAAASEIAKPIAQVKFEARRVAIDQGHKLSAAVAHIVAEQNGAIAAIWHDRGQYDHGYDARPEHLKRSGKVFLVRDSWAAKEGLVARGGAYTDSVTQPAEEVYCSCWWEWITTPHRLPADLLTAKGRMWVKGAAALLA